MAPPQTYVYTACLVLPVLSWKHIRRSSFGSVVAAREEPLRMPCCGNVEVGSAEDTETEFEGLFAVTRTSVLNPVAAITTRHRDCSPRKTIDTSNR